MSNACKRAPWRRALARLIPQRYLCPARKHAAPGLQMVDLSPRWLFPSRPTRLTRCHFLSLTLLAGKVSGGRLTTDELWRRNSLPRDLGGNSSCGFEWCKGIDGVDYTEKMTTITAGTSIALYDREDHCWPVHFSKAEKTSQILLDIVRDGIPI